MSLASDFDEWVGDRRPRYDFAIDPEAPGGKQALKVAQAYRDDGVVLIFQRTVGQPACFTRPRIYVVHRVTPETRERLDRLSKAIPARP